jgi:hypothetical protein
MSHDLRAGIGLWMCLASCTGASTAEDAVAGNPGSSPTSTLQGPSATPAAMMPGTSPATAMPSPIAMAPDPAASSSASELPCEVDSVFAEARCRDCHGAVRQSGAPMSLVTLADLRARSPSDPSKSAAQMSVERMANDARPMPPLPYERVAAARIASVQAWLGNGAVGADHGCANGAMHAPEMTAPDELVGEARDPLTGAPIDLPPDSECDYIVSAMAHAAPGSDAKYQVPSARTSYQCFYYQVPWGDEEVHGLFFQPIIDNTANTHHFVLNTVNDSSLEDGSNARCDLPPGGAIAIWARKTPPTIMNDEVGMVLAKGSDGFIAIQIHYDNPDGRSDIVDGSGFKICATKKLRPNTAAVHWLGRDGFTGVVGETSGTCTNPSSAPVHVVSVMPHMHLAGRRMKIELMRGGNEQNPEIVHDRPFDALNELIWFTPGLTIEPGDVMRTTCYYDPEAGPRDWTQDTSGEMCYNFMIAYPAGVLATAGDDSGLIGGLTNIGGPYRCANSP